MLWLEDKEISSTLETNKYFWHGLPKEIQKLITQKMDLGMTIPSMKQAFKEACHVIEAMLEEEEEGSNFVGWLLLNMKRIRRREHRRLRSNCMETRWDQDSRMSRTWHVQYRV